MPVIRPSDQAIKQYASGTGRLAARIAVHSYGTNPQSWWVLSFDTVIANHMLYHLDDPPAALREFARVLRPGGRVALATNGTDHLAELDAVALAVGRPGLISFGAHSDFTAEHGAGHVARFFTGVATERYPCDLAIPTADPVVDYLDSRADPPLTPGERAAARAFAESRIDADGAYRVGKNSVLITASRPG